MARGTGQDGPHPVDSHVGRRVCERRLALGYNQSDLGRAIGLTFQQVQKYEKGANRISASKLWEIARFLQVDIGFFFTDLQDVSQSQSVDDTATVGERFHATRLTVEIARLAPQLPRRSQKLALELIQSMLDRPTAEPSSGLPGRDIQ